MRKMTRDKRGWIRVVEAFTAVLLIAGVVLIILDRGYIEKADISEGVYQEQDAILKEIQLDDSLREEILNSEIPKESSEAGFPPPIINKVNAKKSAYLECQSKICAIDVDCFLSSVPETDIYVRSVAVTTSQGNYDARQLKLFCWVK